MKRVDLYGRVRHAVVVQGMSRREAARIFGIDRRTVDKMLVFSVPPGYRRKKAPARPKLDPFVGIIDQILETDTKRPKKQRHTSKRIFERLRDEYGFAGGITIVKDYVFAARQRQRINDIRHILEEEELTETFAYYMAVEKYDENDRYFVFITNLSVDSQEIAFQLAKDFRKRWGIETSYRKMKEDFSPKTTSKKYIIRLFYFELVVLFYNLWVFVNILVSFSLFDDVKKDPVVHAMDFLQEMYRVDSPG